MGKAESMRYCRAKALPSALFGGGIPNGDCAWATPVGNALYKVALGHEQSPGKEQQKNRKKGKHTEKRFKTPWRPWQVLPIRGTTMSSACQNLIWVPYFGPSTSHSNAPSVGQPVPWWTVVQSCSVYKCTAQCAANARETDSAGTATNATRAPCRCDLCRHKLACLLAHRARSSNAAELCASGTGQRSQGAVVLVQPRCSQHGMTSHSISSIW